MYIRRAPGPPLSSTARAAPVPVPRRGGERKIAILARFRRRLGHGGNDPRIPALQGGSCDAWGARTRKVRGATGGVSRRTGTLAGADCWRRRAECGQRRFGSAGRLGSAHRETEAHELLGGREGPLDL